MKRSAHFLLPDYYHKSPPMLPPPPLITPTLENSLVAILTYAVLANVLTLAVITVPDWVVRHG